MNACDVCGKKKDNVYLYPDQVWRCDECGKIAALGSAPKTLTTAQRKRYLAWYGRLVKDRKK